MGVRVFRSRTRLDVQGAGKILMNLMSGAAEEARTRNMETLSSKYHSGKITPELPKRTSSQAQRYAGRKAEKLTS